MTHNNFIVKDGQSVPENPFRYSPVNDINNQNAQWVAFETWKQSHTYATDAPNGTWPVGRFEIVWQRKLVIFGNQWEDADTNAYRLHDNFEHYNRLMSEDNKWLTRQFARFIKEVEKKEERNDRIDRLIQIRLRQRICELNIMLKCTHEWIECAGYKCTKCGFITGGNEEINNLIKSKKA